MKSFGLTGGIGMGKTAAAELLRRRGVPVTDTDLLAREIVQPGQPALRELQTEFGGEIIGADGCLRRNELARRVFSNAEARRKLENITHPRIRELWRRQMALWRSERQPVGVVVIPLLFETGAETELDSTICVACSAATQQLRLAQRGWSPEEIRQRIAAQWPIEKKMARADIVLWSEGGLEALVGQLDRVFRAQ